MKAKHSKCVFPEPASSVCIPATQGISLLQKLCGLWTGRDDVFVKLEAETGWTFRILSFLRVSCHKHMSINSISLQLCLSYGRTERGRHTLQKGVSFPWESCLKYRITARRQILVSYWVMCSEIKTLPYFSEKGWESQIIGPRLAKWHVHEHSQWQGEIWTPCHLLQLLVLFPLHYPVPKPYNSF